VVQEVWALSLQHLCKLVPQEVRVADKELVRSSTMVPVCGLFSSEGSWSEVGSHNGDFSRPLLFMSAHGQLAVIKASSNNKWNCS
jgi:hypothetical protein